MLQQKEKAENKQKEKERENLVDYDQMPEPNFEARGRNKKPNITGKEKICLECSLPINMCPYGGEHYNNDTL